MLSECCNRSASNKERLKCCSVINGSEFSSQVMDLWAYHNQVKIDFYRPGKPADNVHVESFNGTLRAECLDAHWFIHLPEAAERIEAWRWEYNASRPHRALGVRSTSVFALVGGVLVGDRGSNTASYSR
jgi:putative transposase